MGLIHYPAVVHVRCETHLKLAIAQNGGGAMVRRVVKDYLSAHDPKWQERQGAFAPSPAVSPAIASDTQPDLKAPRRKVSRRKPHHNAKKSRVSLDKRKRRRV